MNKKKSGYVKENVGIDHSVWKQITNICEIVNGWSPSEELFALYNLAFISGSISGDVLEIGSWCGRSTIALALACQDIDKGKVIACDLFPNKDDWWQNNDGSYSFSVTLEDKVIGGYQQQTVWEEPYKRDIEPLYEEHPNLLTLFLKNIKQFNVSDHVYPLRGDTEDVIKQLSNTSYFRLVFIDGDHSYESVCRDISNVSRYLQPGGWIAFDDAFTMYDGVDRAIQEMIINNNAFTDGVQLTRKLYVARKK